MAMILYCSCFLIKFLSDNISDIPQEMKSKTIKENEGDGRLSVSQWILLAQETADCCPDPGTCCFQSVCCKYSTLSIQSQVLGHWLSTLSEAFSHIDITFESTGSCLCPVEWPSTNGVQEALHLLWGSCPKSSPAILLIWMLFSPFLEFFCSSVMHKQ